MKTMKDKIIKSVKVDTQTGCWIWQKYVMKNGYGQACDGHGKVEYAHRASWEAHNGHIPTGLWVLHKCDNPSCVNPNHLFLGTHLDNMRDAVKKGRLKANIMYGERHPATTLTKNDVIAIRSDGRTHGIIAKDFGITRSSVNKIILRKTWKHI